MVDSVDTANDNADAILSAQIAHRSSTASHRELSPMGACYYCQCQVHSGMLFCDSLCRDDFQAEMAAKARNGK